MKLYFPGWQVWLELASTPMKQEEQSRSTSPLPRLPATCFFHRANWGPFIRASLHHLQVQVRLVVALVARGSSQL